MPRIANTLSRGSLDLRKSDSTSRDSSGMGASFWYRSLTIFISSALPQWRSRIVLIEDSRPMSESQTFGSAAVGDRW
jgi:hypothetical protein